MFFQNNFQNAVDDADWSPINSTVIVSVSGAVICIWDFARKTVEPVMIFTCNTDVHFSLVKFSKHGNVNTLHCVTFILCSSV